MFQWNIFEFKFFHTANRYLFCPRTRKPELIWKAAPFSRKTLSKCLKCRESCSCVITLGLFYIDHYIGFVGFLYQSIGRSTRSISNVCLSPNTITLPFGSLLRKIRRLIALMVKIAQFDHSYVYYVHGEESYTSFESWLNKLTSKKLSTYPHINFCIQIQNNCA